MPSAKKLKIEHLPLGYLKRYEGNVRTHSSQQIQQIVASIDEFGFTNPIIIDEDNVIIAGHGRREAAAIMDMNTVPCIRISNLSEEQKKALRIADNQLALNAGWDNEMLATELRSLRDANFEIEIIGFDESALHDLLTIDQVAEIDVSETGTVTDKDEVPDEPKKVITKPGDIWILGNHRLICGDCRDAADMDRLTEGKSINLVVTSPPYASQRKYDESSGFKPIHPDEYVEWFKSVVSNIERFLTFDGSYFLNIKEHCEDGGRSLYVKDLTLAHVRQWGWVFVDEFCWRNTKNGVPGGWNNRFKNAWEPVFHYARPGKIKFRPEAVSKESDRVFDYSPDTPKTSTGSGFVGERSKDAYKEGLARPSNVLEIGAAQEKDHSAVFPVALPEFFIQAFSDAGDVVYDPFLGSGTTMIAADIHGRICYGMELSPRYCDVAIMRWQKFTGKKAILQSTGEAFSED